MRGMNTFIELLSKGSFEKMATFAKIVESITAKYYYTDIPVLLACSAFIWMTYVTLERRLTSDKAKAWIVMLLSAFILSVVGVVHVAGTIYYNQWTLEAIYTENFASRSVILFFTATNIMDLVLGVNYYSKYLDPLSTFLHHIFYIVFMMVLLAHHYSTGFQLCFLMEIPTLFLAVGTINKNYRSDAAFGATFLLTRVLYNIYLAYQLRALSPEGVIWKVCVLVLLIHLYWFNKWIKVYGSRAFSLKPIAEPSSATTSSHSEIKNQTVVLP